VIGAGTASTYRGQAADARKVGLDLGVSYVVEGSLRRVGPILRINARLLDATSGKQLWAEALDLPLAEFATLSRTLMLCIEVALNYRLSDIESERASIDLPRDPTAQDLVLRARAHLFRASPREGMEQARRMLEQALALDEGSANAHAQLAHVVMTLVNGGWTEDVAGGLYTAEQHVARALAIDPQHVRGHYARGMIRQRQQRFDEALAEFDWVIDAVPSHAVAHQRRGIVKARTGRPAEGGADVLQAIRISPRDPYIHFWYVSLGWISMMLGHDEDAVGYLLRARAASHDTAEVIFYLAAAYALTGRTDDARTTLDEFRRIKPGDTIAKRRLGYQRSSNHSLFVATMERLNDALRPLGMPE
jgi:adenylate cyclase